MRPVVVSLLVLACLAFAVGHTAANTPEIKSISILDLLNSNPELKAELEAGIKQEKRSGKVSPPKPKAPKPVAPTTTSSPVAQADTPVDPPASTDPTPQRNAPGRRRRPTNTHRFAGEQGRPSRVRAPATTEAPRPAAEEQQQNGRRRPATVANNARPKITRPKRPGQQNARTRPAAVTAVAEEETAAPIEPAAVEVEEQGQQQQNARRRRPGARRRRPTTTTDNPEAVPAEEEQPVERPTRRRTNGRTFPGRQQ